MGRQPPLVNHKIISSIRLSTVNYTPPILSSVPIVKISWAVIWVEFVWLKQQRGEPSSFSLSLVYLSKDHVIELCSREEIKSPCTAWNKKCKTRKLRVTFTFFFTELHLSRPHFSQQPLPSALQTLTLPILLLFYKFPSQDRWSPAAKRLASQRQGKSAQPHVNDRLAGISRATATSLA